MTLLTISAFLILISLSVDLCIGFVLKNSLYVSKIIASLNIILISFATCLLVINYSSIYYLALLLTCIFRVVNLSRVVVGRMYVAELSVRFSRTSLILGFTTSLILTIIVFSVDTPSMLAVSFLYFLSAVLITLNCYKSIKQCRPNNTEGYILKSLPTVSVCIPARNETQDLPQCIESVLSSNYPKLEIIVLDDCSHDKTPAIIKDYAHQGVRFINGQEPDRSWIAKNLAMNKLFDESRGDIVIFCGVDVRFRSDSVQKIVEQLDIGLDMISVLPMRDLAHENSVFIQPIRYWWELAVPRLLGARPPVLSTVWAIKRQKFKQIGDFESFKKSVQPERHFAKRLKSTYKFIISGQSLGITSLKRASDQFDTALRTRYPQVKSRPESVFFLICLELLIMIGPFVGLVYGLSNKQIEVLLVSLLSVLLLIFTNLMISRLTVKKTWLFGLFSLPLLVLEEIYIVIRSMLAYEFGVVSWKERNICLPMLAVEKELPKL